MTNPQEAPSFVIDLAQSLAFAGLSGDFNPLHVGEVQARRLQFGHTVCHGVNLVLRAIDCVAHSVNLDRHSQLSVSVVFQQPVLTGTCVQLRVQHDAAAQRFKIAGLVGGRTLFAVQLMLGAHVDGVTASSMDAEPESACAPDAPLFPNTDDARRA